MGQEVELGGDFGQRVLRGEVRCVDTGPGVDDGEGLGRRHVRQGKVVLWRESQDVALALDSLGTKEE